ncbi:MAG TPA: hypothetical protein VJQ84_06425 [Solirubrobacterales bacterium]|nr:hypothetical protein [Solirubrobacterales bacterium]
MERLIWGGDWIELKAHLQRQEARLAVAGVPAELIQAFRSISIACWEDLQRTTERSSGQNPGISKGLLDAREAVHDAARGYLLCRGSRVSRAAASARAAQSVDRLLA